VLEAPHSPADAAAEAAALTAAPELPVGDVAEAPPATGFAALGLRPELVAAVAALGYDQPTPIQAAAIPALLAGRDVLGRAATGTGKTAAFALPMLQAITGTGPGVRGLVVVPTRELATQVAAAIAGYAKPLGTRVVALVGGQPIGAQIRALGRGADLVVATPGRALDHLARKSLALDGVTEIVLDEADEMLDLGFADELEALLGALPAERHAALFSATMAPKVLAIAARHLRDPARISIAADVAAAGEPPRVREAAYLVARRDKAIALARILELEGATSTIVFGRTRLDVDELAVALAAGGRRVEALHGGLSQDQRDRALGRYRNGDSDVLVATDVAARGLDIDHVSHVVNVDVPTSPETYVHRIGRTGRAGREGVAITLLDPRERRALREVERVVRHPIPMAPLPTLAALRTVRIGRLSDELRTELHGDELAAFRMAASELAAERDPLDLLAAALARLSRPAGDAPELELQAPRVLPERPLFTNAGTSAPKPGFRSRGPARAGDAIPRSKIYVGLGRNAGIGPGDLVGAIANEARIASSAIGAIEIEPKFSLVEVPTDDVDRIVAALRETTIRGKRPEIRRNAPR